MRYIPNTEQDINYMLKEIGLESIGDLFRQINNDLILKEDLQLPEPLSEQDLSLHLKKLSEKNADVQSHISFLGGGVYHHFIPSVVTSLISRAEFFTSYTPYQPEISQGTLQAMFEYQTLMCMLTGMDVANASMYDGATSAAEAVLMAKRIQKKRKVLLSETLHPEYRNVIKAYAGNGNGVDVDGIVEIPFNKNGTTSTKALKEALDNDVACVLLQSPNFFGVIEDQDVYERIIHGNNALFISVFTEPVAFGLIKPPGDFNADIVCGEGQSLGMPPGYGGPLLGIFTSKNQFVRNMPGRIVGEAVDRNGARSFVLTLAAREQHIRREKSTSNICTNQGLCALTAAVYLSWLGKKGIEEMALLNYRKAEYAKHKLEKIDGINLKFSQPNFNEFVIEIDMEPEGAVMKLAEKGILAGFPI